MLNQTSEVKINYQKRVKYLSILYETILNDTNLSLAHKNMQRI